MSEKPTFSLFQPKTFSKSDQTDGKGMDRILDSYKVMLYKVAFGINPRYKHVKDRSRELDQWARKFTTGWPWINNEKFKRELTPILVRVAEGYARQIEDIDDLRNPKKKEAQTVPAATTLAS